ncbi:MAG: hypothetical protein WBA42_04950 [Mesorhizobium sp.]
MGEPLRFAVHGAGADGNLTLRNAGAHLSPANSPASDYVRSPINTRSSPLRQQQATALPSPPATLWKLLQIRAASNATKARQTDMQHHVAHHPTAETFLWTDLSSLTHPASGPKPHSL